jgi:hypothetical protein|tara:strand:+ start:1166 stop:2182 length:1017 start_codon:yes stop_codon:yes gene_type:complete
MATDTIIQQSTQAPYIEKRSEQLLSSVFGDPNAVKNPGETDAAFNIRRYGLSGVSQPIPGQQIAGFTGPQTQAFDLASQGIGGYQDELAKAGLMTDTGGITSALAGATIAGGTDKYDPSTMIDPYMNEYNTYVTDEIRRQGDIAKNKLAGQATKGNVFGGSRYGVQQSELDKGIASQIGMQSQKNFENALRASMGSHEAGEKRDLMAGQQLGNLAKTQGQLGALQGGLGQLESSMLGQDVRSLLGIGGMQQQMGQAGLDIARANQIAAQKEPFNRVGFASDILRGVPSSSTQYTQQPSTNPLLQYAGLGIAGLSGLGAFGDAFPNNPMSQWMGAGNTV